jgi:hypothetical protein
MIRVPMCFRLLAAAGHPAFPASSMARKGAPSPPSPEPGGGETALSALERLAFSAGLDVRLVEAGGRHFAELALGDCACSLYTGADGPDRVAAFVRPLLLAGIDVQLLLLHDASSVDWRAGEPVPVPLEALCRAGLEALPEGRAARIVPSGPAPT